MMIDFRPVQIWTLNSVNRAKAKPFVFFQKIVLSADCRTVQFQPQMKDKCLENHVIRSMKVQSQSKCELRCYQEADCVSYNYGPTHSDTPSCDLNNGTHLQVSSSDFVTKDHYIYRHIVVRNETSESFNFCYHFLFI